MSRPSGDPLTRISLNLLSSDLEILRRYHPSGYQTKIRELVHEYVKALEGDETNAALQRMYS